MEKIKYINIESFLTIKHFREVRRFNRFIKLSLYKKAIQLQKARFDLFRDEYKSI